MAVDPQHRYSNKKLAKTILMILNWKKHFDLHGLYKNNSEL